MTSMMAPVISNPSSPAVDNKPLLSSQDSCTAPPVNRSPAFRKVNRSDTRSLNNAADYIWLSAESPYLGHRSIACSSQPRLPSGTAQLYRMLTDNAGNSLFGSPLLLYRYRPFGHTAHSPLRRACHRPPWSGEIGVRSRQCSLCS